MVCDMQACSDMAIKGFPTWVVNGQKYEGEQSLADLEEEMAANME